MKRLYCLVVIVMAFMLGMATLAYAGEVYVEGEGFVEPTAKSQEPFNPQLLLQRPAEGGRTTSSLPSYSITVNPLATSFPNIIINVTVLDNSGNSVTGLTQGDFSITEKSTSESSATAETITSFSESASSGSGISFSLVFDVSGSMDGARLDDAKTAAINFLNNCGSIDRASLVKFSSSSDVKIVQMSDWVNTDVDSNGTPDIIDAINGLSAGGGTAVYDGTAKGIETLSQEPSPKAVIVFTDGATSGDALSINMVIAKANNEGVPLYTIGLGTDPQNLKDMASSTGGAYHYAPSAQEMSDIYASIAQDIRSQYTIGYTSHNAVLDGTTRTVVVTYSGSSGSGMYVVNYRPEFTLDSSTTLLSSQSQPPSTALTISGYVTDLDAAAQTQSLAATLFYRGVNDGTYTSVSLTLVDQGSGKYSFSSDIPAATVQEPGIDYYLHATDGIQEIYSPFNYNILPYSISVQNHAPVIVHTPVTTATKNMPVAITADVTDPDSGDSLSKVTLYYRTHNPNQATPYFSLTMTSSNALTYNAEIPADMITEAGVDYFISAWDSYQVRADKGTSLNPYIISISSADIQITITDPANCAPFLNFSATISIQ